MCDTIWQPALLLLIERGSSERAWYVSVSSKGRVYQCERTVGKRGVGIEACFTRHLFNTLLFEDRRDLEMFEQRCLCRRLHLGFAVSATLEGAQRRLQDVA